MPEFEFYLTGSLEKIFPDSDPQTMDTVGRISILKGEVPAVQIAYTRRCSREKLPYKYQFQCEVTGIAAPARFRDVELVPSAFPCYEVADENYLSTRPGLFPDLLKPKKDNFITPMPGQFRSLWLDFPDTAMLEAGLYHVSIRLTMLPEVCMGDGTLQKLGEDTVEEVLTFELEVGEAVRAPQSLIHTEWFHADCLAEYYGTEVFSENHWEIIEKQIALAGKELGVNMILTPVFTPPLDTAKGGERTTVQLAEIELAEDGYHFDFSKLKRWCDICRRSGIENLEIAHLFTQWGAEATPKIYVTEDGVKKQKFGWHMPAVSLEYRRFLEAFLPALQTKLEEFGFDREHVYFHISDEPSKENLESYMQAKAAVEDLLKGWKVIDALSDYVFYEKGIVEKPIPSNDHIQAFIDHGVEDLWVYYCCGQSDKVPNRFFAMPSARNRIMGVLMYLYKIKGFLHWGYNFYNSMFSIEHINPFFDTHAGYAFPSGDPFLVYPGADGEPWSSIRAEVQREGLDDMRALEELEKRVGRERVVEIIYENVKEKITFEKYPRDAQYLYRLRNRVAAEMREAAEK